MKKGKRMKQLEELEKKVLLIIQKNKDLENVNNALTMENKKLVDQNHELEAKLTKQNKDSESLESEKSVIKSSIEELLDSIGSVEETGKQVTK
jgi:2C-methyl-D-erythritol 2,4-cyclodiphosphate synthase